MRLRNPILCFSEFLWREKVALRLKKRELRGKAISGWSCQQGAEGGISHLLAFLYPSTQGKWFADPKNQDNYH